MDGFDAHGEVCCSFHCFFLHLSGHGIHRSICPSIRKLCVKSVILPWPRVYMAGTQKMEREGSCGGRVSSPYPGNAVQVSTAPSTCPAATWLCLLMGHQEYALTHAFPGLGFKPRLSLALASLLSLCPSRIGEDTL